MCARAIRDVAVARVLGAAPLRVAEWQSYVYLKSTRGVDNVRPDPPFCQLNR